MAGERQPGEGGPGGGGDVGDVLNELVELTVSEVEEAVVAAAAQQVEEEDDDRGRFVYREDETSSSESEASPPVSGILELDDGENRAPGAAAPGAASAAAAGAAAGVTMGDQLASLGAFYGDDNMAGGNGSMPTSSVLGGDENVRMVTLDAQGHEQPPEEEELKKAAVDGHISLIEQPSMTEASMAESENEDDDDDDDDEEDVQARPQEGSDSESSSSSEDEEDEKPAVAAAAAAENDEVPQAAIEAEVARLRGKSEAVREDPGDDDSDESEEDEEDEEEADESYNSSGSSSGSSSTSDESDNSDEDEAKLARMRKKTSPAGLAAAALLAKQEKQGGKRKTGASRWGTVANVVRGKDTDKKKRSWWGKAKAALRFKKAGKALQERREEEEARKAREAAKHDIAKALRAIQKLRAGEIPSSSSLTEAHEEDDEEENDEEKKEAASEEEDEDDDEEDEDFDEDIVARFRRTRAKKVAKKAAKAGAAAAAAAPAEEEEPVIYDTDVLNAMDSLLDQVVAIADAEQREVDDERQIRLREALTLADGTMVSMDPKWLPKRIELATASRKLIEEQAAAEAKRVEEHRLLSAERARDVLSHRTTTRVLDDELRREREASEAAVAKRLAEQAARQDQTEEELGFLLHVADRMVEQAGATERRLAAERERQAREREYKLRATRVHEDAIRLRVARSQQDQDMARFGVPREEWTDDMRIRAALELARDVRASVELERFKEKGRTPADAKGIVDRRVERAELGVYVEQTALQAALDHLHELEGSDSESEEQAVRRLGRPLTRAERRAKAERRTRRCVARARAQREVGRLQQEQWHRAARRREEEAAAEEERRMRLAEQVAREARERERMERMRRQKDSEAVAECMDDMIWELEAPERQEAEVAECLEDIIEVLGHEEDKVEVGMCMDDIVQAVVGFEERRQVKATMDFMLTELTKEDEVAHILEEMVVATEMGAAVEQLVAEVVAEEAEDVVYDAIEQQQVAECLDDLVHTTAVLAHAQQMRSMLSRIGDSVERTQKSKEFILRRMRPVIARARRRLIARRIAEEKAAQARTKAGQVLASLMTRKELAATREELAHLRAEAAEIQEKQKRAAEEALASERRRLEAIQREASVVAKRAFADTIETAARLVKRGRADKQRLLAEQEEANAKRGEAEVKECVDFMVTVVALEDEMQRAAELKERFLRNASREVELARQLQRAAKEAEEERRAAVAEQELQQQRRVRAMHEFQKRIEQAKAKARNSQDVLAAQERRRQAEAEAEEKARRELLEREHALAAKERAKAELQERLRDHALAEAEVDVSERWETAMRASRRGGASVGEVLYVTGDAIATRVTTQKDADFNLYEPELVVDRFHSEAGKLPGLPEDGEEWLESSAADRRTAALRGGDEEGARPTPFLRHQRRRAAGKRAGKDGCVVM